MKLKLALKVAEKLANDPANRLVLYRAKNGQWMTGKLGDVPKAARAWNPGDFIASH